MMDFVSVLTILNTGYKAESTKFRVRKKKSFSPTRVISRRFHLGMSFFLGPWNGKLIRMKKGRSSMQKPLLGTILIHAREFAAGEICGGCRAR
jgi:hypothetical protein